MPIYKVRYSSLNTSYGPAFIEAETEDEARRKFARGNFSKSEMPLISARAVTSQEMIRALSHEEEQ